MKTYMKATSKQYRYPDTRSQREKQEDYLNRTNPVEIPVNRKQRKGKVIYV